MSETTPLQDLEAICAEIFERWDKDQRAGKLLAALAGRVPGYRADVDRVRAALADQTNVELLERQLAAVLASERSLLLEIANLRGAKSTP